MRWQRFEEATGVLGCQTDRSRAVLFDFDNKTIFNLRNRGPAGDRTVAKVLSILGQHQEVLSARGISVNFDEFFEVSEQVA